jgi:hypothetical protein
MHCDDASGSCLKVALYVIVIVKTQLCGEHDDVVHSHSRNVGGCMATALHALVLCTECVSQSCAQIKIMRIVPLDMFVHENACLCAMHCGVEVCNSKDNATCVSVQGHVVAHVACFCIYNFFAFILHVDDVVYEDLALKNECVKCRGVHFCVAPWCPPLVPSLWRGWKNACHRHRHRVSVSVGKVDRYRDHVVLVVVSVSVDSAGANRQNRSGQPESAGRAGSAGANRENRFGPYGPVRTAGTGSYRLNRPESLPVQAAWPGTGARGPAGLSESDRTAGIGSNRLDRSRPPVPVPVQAAWTDTGRMSPPGPPESTRGAGIDSGGPERACLLSQGPNVSILGCIKMHQLCPLYKGANGHIVECNKMHMSCPLFQGANVHILWCNKMHVPCPLSQGANLPIFGCVKMRPFGAFLACKGCAIMNCGMRKHEIMGCFAHGKGAMWRKCACHNVLSNGRERHTRITSR